MTYELLGTLCECHIVQFTKGKRQEKKFPCELQFVNLLYLVFVAVVLEVDPSLVSVCEKLGRISRRASFFLDSGRTSTFLLRLALEQHQKKKKKDFC